MTTEIVLRAAALAGACAEALSDQTEMVAAALRAGDSVRALDGLVLSADRLQRFLIYLDLVAELMEGRTRKQLVDYGRRLSGLLDKIEDALRQRDLGRLGLLLAHGLAPVLRDYDTHADEVIFALTPARAA
jgi:hypothetical protein